MNNHPLEIDPEFASRVMRVRSAKAKVLQYESIEKEAVRLQDASKNPYDKRTKVYKQAQEARLNASSARRKMFIAESELVQLIMARLRHIPDRELQGLPDPKLPAVAEKS